MNNMKVAKKLILGFSIVALFCVVVGCVGIYELTRINNADMTLYKEQTKPLPDIAKIIEYSQRLRIHPRNAIIYSGNAERLRTVETDIKNDEELFEVYIAAYEPTIKDDASRKAFDEAKRLYYSSYKPSVDEVLEGAHTGVDQAELMVLMEETVPATDAMVKNFTICLNNKVAGGEATAEVNHALYSRMLKVIITVIVLAVAVALWLAIYISGIISKPLGPMCDFLVRWGTTGDLSLSEEDKKSIAIANKDEIGMCQRSLVRVAERQTEVDEKLGKVAEGDLSADVKLLSEQDSMGLAINQMVESLNVMFGELRTASSQVSTGSGQVSQAAQGLASGSSEQAASIEEFTAALSELREKTNHNADSAVKAREANEKAATQLTDSMLSMDGLMEAMHSIDESSSSITKIIKVIDDIAFQTNILALNAAVEAARAGQHGKGFAVVADEVRNLAAKSADATKETAALIEGSSERVAEGNQIVTKTKASLEMVVEYAQELARRVGEVTAASTEQAMSIEELNQGIEQISTVVQANSATAEESAAAAQEMSAQAVVLDEIVAKFKLKQADHLKYEEAGPAKTDVSGFPKPGDAFSRSGFALVHGKY